MKLYLIYENDGGVGVKFYGVYDTYEKAFNEVNENPKIYNKTSVEILSLNLNELYQYCYL